MLVRGGLNAGLNCVFLRAVTADALTIRRGEKRQDLACLGMSASLGLRVQHLTIDDDVKDALRTVNERCLGNDVLVVGQEVLGRAHGVTRIVSTNAVLDADFVGGHAASLHVKRFAFKVRLVDLATRGN